MAKRGRKPTKGLSGWRTKPSKSFPGGRSLESNIVERARERAVKKNLPFDLKATDIKIPAVCPVLNIPLYPATGKGGGGRDNSPSLDRIIPTLGYVPSNIIVVSMRANQIRSNGTPEEHRKIADFYEQLLQKRGLK